LTTVRVLSIKMHSMSLTLVTEETSIGGEFELPTFSVFALVGLQMRIQVFAISISWARPRLGSIQLTHSRTSASWAYVHIVSLWRRDI
jgi:hypothetical protein